MALGLPALAAPATLLAAGAPDAKPGSAPAAEATKTADPPASGARAPGAAPPGAAAPSAVSTRTATTPAPPPARQRASDPAPAGHASPRAKRRAPKARVAAAGSVTIEDFKFLPSTITVHVGDTVTWTNKGRTPHSATAKGGSFDTGVFPPGTSRSQSFSKAGTFSYFCSVHPFMHGTVRVVGGASGGGGSAKSGSSGSTSSAGSGAASGSGSSSGSSSTSAPAQKPDSSGGAGSPGSSPASGSGGSLPATGFDAGLAAAVGAALVAAGVALRRRTREQPQRRSARRLPS